MSPSRGSIHRRPRSDSGAVRLWGWARARRSPWTCPEAAEAVEGAPRRMRAIVAALAESGLLKCVRESEHGGERQEAAEWELSAAGRALTSAPVLIVDGESGAITGIRAASDGNGAEKLRKQVTRARKAGMSARAVAHALQLNDRTLRRMLSGETPIGSDDPVIERAARLA